MSYTSQYEQGRRGIMLFFNEPQPQEACVIIGGFKIGI